MSASRRFEGLACIVTGSTGLAASAARVLAREGGLVMIASRTAGHADALADEIRGAGGRVEALLADVSTEGGAEGTVGACVDAFERVDCVYNVAGISGRRFGDGPLHELSLDGWLAVMSSNATSTFLVCRAAVRAMLRQPRREGGSRGAILNMSSVLARSPSPRHFATHAYAASKGAIEAFSRATAAYYAPHGIRVNVIAPSLVATPMSRRAQSDPEIRAYLAGKQPLAGGPLSAEEVTSTALHLLSDESRMVTGQVVTVDGGWDVSESSD